MHPAILAGRRCPRGCVRMVTKAGRALRRGPSFIAARLTVRYKDAARRLRGEAPPLFTEEDLALYGDAGRGLEEASAATYRLWEPYVPSAWEGRVQVIRASHTRPAPGSDEQDFALGWGRLAGAGVAVRTMDCGHEDMCRIGQSRALAKLLQACIADAQAGA